jgi:hypothetical protein
MAMSKFLDCSFQLETITDSLHPNQPEAMVIKALEPIAHRLKLNEYIEVAQSLVAMLVDERQKAQRDIVTGESLLEGIA